MGQLWNKLKRNGSIRSIHELFEKNDQMASNLQTFIVPKNYLQGIVTISENALLIIFICQN